MSEEIKDVTPDSGGELYSVDDIADAFADEVSAELGEEQAAEAPVEEQAEEQMAEQPAEVPEYPMPEGWEQAMWDGMAPEVRGAVHKLVSGHAERVSAHERAMREAAAQHAAVIEKANADAASLLEFMQEVTMGDFSGIDWKALESDPATYLQLQRAYENRMAAIQSLKEQWGARSRTSAEARAKEYQDSLRAELATAIPKVKALMGAGFTADGFRNELKSYLEKAGVPAAAIGAMSKSYEMELATKAMLFDRFQSAREAAAAKVASAPAVQAPRGAVPADGGDKLKQARANLSRNPDSNDAAASLFEALLS